MNAMIYVRNDPSKAQKVALHKQYTWPQQGPLQSESVFYPYLLHVHTNSSDDTLTRYWWHPGKWVDCYYHWWFVMMKHRVVYRLVQHQMTTVQLSSTV